MSKLTLSKIRAFKQEGRKIVMLTVYDYPGACLLDAAGVDLLLVGDSLGNVVQGKATTLSVTLDEMIYHAEMVVRGVDRSFVVVDIPFPFCQLGSTEAIRAAARILKETSADAVKFEGGASRASTVAALVDAGIPVLGHCGLRPQEIRQTGGYFVQRQREELFQDITAIEKAGAFGILLECIETELAREATSLLRIPTIGIGAGPFCDGQVLVFHDLLGYKPEQTRTPKHVKQYADLQTIISNAVKSYADDVRNAVFPDVENSF
jgi:3-methyl-2-oxobutanoate hydroxymethyltransferase